MSSFRNPANGYEETVTSAGFWCLLFGCLYFVAKGIWTHAFLSFVLAFFTAGISWFIYPLFARQIVISTYQRRGWIQVTGLDTTAAAQASQPALKRRKASYVFWAIGAVVFIGLVGSLGDSSTKRPAAAPQRPNVERPSYCKNKAATYRLPECGISESEEAGIEASRRKAATTTEDAYRYFSQQAHQVCDKPIAQLSMQDIEDCNAPGTRLLLRGNDP